MKRRDQYIEDSQRVVREHEVAVAAVDALDRALRADPSFLTGRGLEQQDLSRFRRLLSDTYVIRIYAVFENALRVYWTSHVRDTEPAMAQLISAVAARCRIPDAQLTAVDQLRQYRNTVVHDSQGTTETLSIVDAARRIRRYLAQMPPQW
jgi:hypothetical protein